jgi:superfamily II DNA or RNA helicase
MPVPYSSEDLGRMFEGRVLTRGRSLVLIGAVQVRLEGETIKAAVEERGERFACDFTPSATGRRTVFESHCSCRKPACVHLAAASFAALDRFPELRKIEQATFIDRLSETNIASEGHRLTVDLCPGEGQFAAFLIFALVGERSGRIKPTTPAEVLADANRSAAARTLARLVGSGQMSKTGITAALVPTLLTELISYGQARWLATGKRLIAGADRSFPPNTPPNLPAKSAVILGTTGPWYVDASTGAVGRVHLRAAAKPVMRQTRAATPAPRRAAPPAPPPRRALTPVAAERMILDRAMTPTLRLRRLQCPDEMGRPQTVDALMLDFDYEGAFTHTDDERQFIRLEAPQGGMIFVRRDLAAEAAAQDALKSDGFMQMRVTDGPSARGRRVYIFRGRDAAEQWQRFVAERVPALMSLGWKNLIDKDFGPRLVEKVGTFDMQVADDTNGGFSLLFSIELDGERIPLLPILTHLMERGGMAAARVVDGELITSLDDGRIVKLPADRVSRLLAIMTDLVAAEHRMSDDTLVLPEGEAATLIDLEDLLVTRWKNAAAIEAYVERFRNAPEIAPVDLPKSFTADLRPYQQHGVDWLQHLREHSLSGFLADDMGLGKTAQTIAHIAVEKAAGRLDRPALIVVPTSLVTNWTAELKKFSPGLRLVILHGLDRHERRGQLAGADVVITTYTVLARDIEEMKDLAWHIVVLDEAQVIKSPDAKATRAVCQLDTRHRLCLSGTPIENNLGELWSQFAFLMPGLLGDRRGFAKRFRTPIEKKGDDVRRMQLVRRIKPFILRRTKSDVATELPPKHTILRRITLRPEQRDLYEAIRATLYDRVREEIANRPVGQSRIIVLDALLKLRQACCDPRLVKLPSARKVETSSKLDDLMEMVNEMIPEGRRILIFSQFTSMLDLIKLRLNEENFKFVELRGDTRDRAEPVRSFEAGEVPIFLISLKAGGRGLNLVSADTVIHYDPWWNPAVEDQASDRAYRIGQTKSVFVFKLIAADTVEERINELQQRKAELAGIAFGEHPDMSGLEQDDIEYLFGSSLDRQVA